MLMPSAQHTATDGTRRELEPTSNVSAYFTVSAIFAVQLASPESDRQANQSLRWPGAQTTQCCQSRNLIMSPRPENPPKRELHRITTAPTTGYRRKFDELIPGSACGQVMGQIPCLISLAEYPKALKMCDGMRVQRFTLAGPQWGKVCCVDGLKCVILEVCNGIRIQRFALAYSTVAPEPTTATNGTWRELEPTSNVTAYLTISAIFAAQLAGPERDRQNDQSAPLAVPSAVLRYNASSLRRGRPQVWPATDCVLGSTGEGGAGGPVVAGGPRGGWPPADTGIVLPEYSTPRYRDLLPPRLGGKRWAGLASPWNDQRIAQSLRWPCVPTRHCCQPHNL